MKLAVFTLVLAALLVIAANAPSPAANVIAIWMAAIWVIVWAWKKLAWRTDD